MPKITPHDLNDQLAEPDDYDLEEDQIEAELNEYHRYPDIDDDMWFAMRATEGKPLKAGFLDVARFSFKREKDK